MIFNIGGGQPKKLPVLNASYPADASTSLNYGGSASATFGVKIATDGMPKRCTYQWYLNGDAIPGETGSSCTVKISAEGTYSVHCVVTNKAGSVTSRTATLTATYTTRYLFYSGDQMETVTGGWEAANHGAQIASSWDDDYYGAASVDSALNVTTAKIVDVYGGRCYTKKKVDLTKYSKLRFNYSTYGRVRFAVSNDPMSDTFVKSGHVSLQYTNYWDTKTGTFDLDVSGLSGEYYIVIIGGTGGAYDTMSASISRAWAE